MADFNIRLNKAQNYTVTQEKTVVAEFLSDLADVSVPDRASQDKYVLSYNATTQKYELVSADTILTTSAVDSDIPQSFVDQLDVELDNKINMDGGSF